MMLRMRETGKQLQGLRERVGWAYVLIKCPFELVLRQQLNQEMTASTWCSPQRDNNQTPLPPVDISDNLILSVSSRRAIGVK